MFKSSYGNNYVNQELISRTVDGTNGGILVFGTSGNVSSFISTPIDSNIYIKGGHQQYDTFAQINAIPVANRTAGMYAFLNSSFETLTDISTNPDAPQFIKIVGSELYVFATTTIYV